MITATEAPIKGSTKSSVPLRSAAAQKLLRNPPRDEDLRPSILFALALMLRQAGVPYGRSARILKSWYQKHFPPRPKSVVGLAVYAAYTQSRQNLRVSWRWLEATSGIRIEDADKPFFSGSGPEGPLPPSC